MNIFVNNEILIEVYNIFTSRYKAVLLQYNVIPPYQDTSALF